MPALRLRHPRYPEIVAHFGHDPNRGFWVRVVERLVHEFRHPKTGKVVRVERDWVRDRYDVMCEGYCDTDPFLGALTLLAEQGFFPMDDLLEALELLREQGPQEIPRRLRRVARVIQDLDEAVG